MIPAAGAYGTTMGAYETTNVAVDVVSGRKTLGQGAREVAPSLAITATGLGAIKAAPYVAKAVGPYVDNALDAVRGSGRLVDDAFEVTVDSKQFSHKLKTHAKEFELDFKNATDRATFRSIIDDVANNYDQRVSGVFNGQGADGGIGAVEFLIKGNTVMITKPDGAFVTIMKDAVDNKFVRDALEKAKELADD